MKKKNLPMIIIRVIAILMLFIALGDNQYGYYQILRWVVAGVTGYSAYLAYEQEKTGWTWILAIAAILFNPISPIHLTRDTWSIINLVVAVIIFVSIFKVKAWPKITK